MGAEAEEAEELKGLQRVVVEGVQEVLLQAQVEPELVNRECEIQAQMVCAKMEGGWAVSFPAREVLVSNLCLMSNV